MLSVAIIEDNRLVREGMTDMLDALDDLQVVFAHPTLEMASFRCARPDVLLLDVGLQDGNSLRFAESVREEMPEVRVIVMDLLPTHEDIADFVNAGVEGFILKDASLDDFVETIRAIARGERILPSRMTGSLFSQIAHGAVSRGVETTLEAVRMTQREREVIALIASGLSNKEIAMRLGVATDTVKSHVRNVMDKLALRSRLQIAAYVHAREA
jgi:DNA-binding NarL/FixJ family response regulator